MDILIAAFLSATFIVWSGIGYMELRHSKMRKARAADHYRNR